MKIRLLSFFILVSSLLIFTSCEQQESPTVFVAFVEDNGVGMPGYIVHVHPHDNIPPSQNQNQAFNVFMTTNNNGQVAHIFPEEAVLQVDVYNPGETNFVHQNIVRWAIVRLEENETVTYHLN